MPITKSAKKAVRVSARKRSFNERNKRELKEAVKKIEKLANSDKKVAEKELPKAYAAIDKAAKRGVIKKNTAARKKSRLSRLLSK